MRLYPDKIMAKISKIIYVVTQSEFGGAQQYVADLSNSLPRDQFSVSIVAGGDGLFFSRLGPDVETHILKHMVREINPHEDILCFFELVALFKKERPDIIHLNSSKAGVIGAFAAKFAGVKKIIYTAHGFVFNEPLPSWKKTFYRVAEWLSGFTKDTIICVSDFDKKTGIDASIAPVDKFITIHNGIAPKTFSSAREARAKIGIDESKLVIGTIANFYPSKNLPTLIKAFALIAKKNANLHLVLIGSGEDETIIRNVIDAHNLKQQTSVITNAQTDGAALLPGFTIFVLPSVKEGLPYTIIEAMAAEVPVIATRVGGIPELIEHNKNGLLVEPRNPEALASAIDQLLHNRALCKQFTSVSHSKVSIEFSLEQMIKKTIEVYQQ